MREVALYCRFTEECRTGMLLASESVLSPLGQVVPVQPMPCRHPQEAKPGEGQPLTSGSFCFAQRPFLCLRCSCAAFSRPLSAQVSGNLVRRPLDGRPPEARAAALPAWAGSALHTESDTGRGPCSTCSPNSVSALLPLRVMTFGLALNTPFRK